MIKEFGKFEGEPEWAPHIWELALDGVGDDVYHGGNLWSYIRPDERDITKWPDLAKTKYVGIYEDDQGFVHTVQCDSVPEGEEET